MKNLFLASSLLLCFSASLFASKGKGGGEPIAIEFANILDTVYLEVHQDKSLADRINFEELDAHIEQLKDSLGSSSKESLIQVVEERPKDSYGVEKSIVSDRIQTSVKIHRQSWIDAPLNHKKLVTAMEILWFAKVNENRYQLAHDLRAKYVQTEESAKLLRIRDLFESLGDTYHIPTEACTHFYNDSFYQGRRLVEHQIDTICATSKFRTYKVLKCIPKVLSYFSESLENRDLNNVGNLCLRSDESSESIKL